MERQTAASKFTQLDGLRTSLLSRFERLAELTQPSILPPEYHDGQTTELTNGYSSLGALATNHLNNKLMLAMFAPSRPFMRLELPDSALANMKNTLGVDESVITDGLVEGERRALKQLELSGSRVKLFEVLMHLQVVGNVMMDLSGDSLGVIPIRNYVVRRSKSGDVAECVIKECVLYSDLEASIKSLLEDANQLYKPDDTVTLYKWLTRNSGKYKMTSWVNDTRLPQQFEGQWKPETLPYRALVWRLPVGQDYGVGRVEETCNDLVSHETLSEALTDGAILASTFRWLVDPTAMTKAEDLTQASNGAAIPGSKGDVDIVFANIGQQLNTVQAIDAEFTRRIGAAFLMNSAITRDAERVTAEEIRIQAQELETGLGGVYSHLALDIQRPLAVWLLKTAKVKIEGSQIEPVIVTGLDALSRSADLDNLMRFLGLLGSLDGLSSVVRSNLRLNSIITTLAAGCGIDRGKYIVSEEEAQARLQAEMAAQQQPQPQGPM